MSKNILIADDEKGIRDSLKRLLEFESYKVLLANDGPGALISVRDERVDLVLLDVHFDIPEEDLLGGKPGMSGRAIEPEEIRTLATLPSLDELRKAVQPILEKPKLCGSAQ